MKIGLMNDPTKDLEEEIKSALDANCDFFEITVEPPKASREEIGEKLEEIKDLLEKFPERPVGHTPYYLNFSLPFPRIVDSCLRELYLEIDLLGELGAEKVLVHFPYPLGGEGYHDRTLNAIRRLSKFCEELSLKLCVENSPFWVDISTEEVLSMENVYLALDVGHAFILGDLDRLIEIGKEHGKMAHLHVHDNKGKSDDHLPIGAGKIPWEEIIPKIKSFYDGTVTVEDHSPSREIRRISLKLFKELWNRSGDEGGDL